jgi:hypothetical protein
VLLAWPQERGVLGLKAFRMGPQQVVALDFSTWGAPSDLSRIEADLRGALARLSPTLTRALQS